MEKWLFQAFSGSQSTPLSAYCWSDFSLPWQGQVGVIGDSWKLKLSPMPLALKEAGSFFKAGHW